MATALLTSLLLSLILGSSFSHAWSQVELDLFDLVEEVNENFYDFLQIPQDAPAGDIRRSYRKLSLQYHPDKNRDDPNAAETFRKIGAVAEILRNEETRHMYNEVLENGLPDWRQPVYYYRRVRKMSIIELVVLLLTVIVVGQLLYGWAAYAEKQLVLYDLRQRKEKKDRKAKGRKGPQQMTQLDAEVLYHEALAKAALPHYSKLFPYVLVKKTFQYSFVFLCILWGLTKRRQGKENVEQRGEEEGEEGGRNSSNRQQSRNKRRYVNEKKEEEEINEEMVASANSEEKDTSTSMSNAVNEGDTSDVQETEEAKRQREEEDEEKRRQDEEEERKKSILMEEKERELQEELQQLEESIMENEKGKKNRRNKKAHSSKVKSPLADKSLEYQQFVKEDEESLTEEKSSMPKPLVIEDTATVEGTAAEEEQKRRVTGSTQQWSQEQQKELEYALKQYSKEESNRWELIANCVTGKTKEDCMERYKELVELIRKKKPQ